MFPFRSLVRLTVTRATSRGRLWCVQASQIEVFFGHQDSSLAHARSPVFRGENSLEGTRVFETDRSQAMSGLRHRHEARVFREAAALCQRILERFRP